MIELMSKSRTRLRIKIEIDTIGMVYFQMLSGAYSFHVKTFEFDTFSLVIIIVISIFAICI